jgi:hypothetical protein
MQGHVKIVLAHKHKNISRPENLDFFPCVSEENKDAGCPKGLPEVFITIYGLAAAEAEVLATVSACHLVAPFCFGDGHFAFWTYPNILVQFSDVPQFLRYLLLSHPA